MNELLTCLVKFLVSLSRGRLASLDSEKFHSSIVLILAMRRQTPEPDTDLERRKELVSLGDGQI